MRSLTVRLSRAAWLALLLATACRDDDGGRGGGSPKVGEGVESIGIPAAVELRVGAAPVRAAMYAVAYHSRQTRPDLPPAFLPIPLEEAAQILRDGARPRGGGERDGFAESRRRRAAIELALGGLERVDGTWRVRQPNDHAIGILLGGFRGAFDDKLQQILNDVFAIPPDPTVTILPPNVLKQMRLELWRFFELELQLAIPSCGKSDPPSTTISVDANTGVVKATTTLAITRGLDAVAKALDPQNWDALDDPSGKPCCPYFYLSDVYQQNSNGEWAPDKCPPKPGSRWDGHLLEVFLADIGKLSQANFATLLKISMPSAQAPAWGYDYALGMAKSYLGMVTIYPSGNTPVTLTGYIDTDAGDVEANLDDSNALVVQLSAVKRMHFTGWRDPQGVSYDSTMNAWAEVSLKEMGDAMMEAACCAPLDPAPCARRGRTP